MSKEIKGSQNNCFNEAMRGNVRAPRGKCRVIPSIENKPESDGVSVFSKTPGKNFQVAIHFHPGHPQERTLIYSFSAPV